jgi:hypothetical protein
MADPTKDLDSKPLYDADLPDEEPGEEPEESAEAQGDEDEGEYEAAAEAPRTGRFGFGRNRGAEQESERRPIGSVRESHERVHIDDRPSAIYAILCAGALLGVLAVAWLSSVVPAAAVPTLAPLVVPTAQATPVSSASIVVTPSATAAPTATPAPTASPSAAPSK